MKTLTFFKKGSVSKAKKIFQQVLIVWGMMLTIEPELAAQGAPSISIEDRCTCLNNSNGPRTGQFSERVVVISQAGETWTVISSTGAFLPGASVPPVPGEEIPVGASIPEDTMNPGEYLLDLVHVDSFGYSLQVSNGVDTLSIANRCFYPVPAINLLDNYCLNHPVINLQVSAPPYAGTFSVLINGNPSTTFNPAVLGVGLHTVVYTFTPSGPVNDSMPGCVMTLSRDIEVFPNYVGGLSCSHINVGLNELGFAKITPEMLLLGNYGCTSTFIVDIMGRDSDTLWCSDIGKTFMVKVTDPVRNNTCWGNVTPEDKMAPSIRCQDTTLFCGTDFFNRPFSDFVDVTDNCDPNFTLILLSQSPLNNPRCHPDYSASITRTYRATDRFGNTSICTHTIFFDRPDLDDIEAPDDVMLPCDSQIDLSPEALGWPHVNGQEIGFFCEFSISYQDFTFTTCPGSRKIKRQFWVTDICTMQMRLLQQEIHIIDDTAPTIACPADLTIFNDFGQCSATYILPTVQVSDNCAPANQIQIFWYVNGNPLPPNATSVQLPVGNNTITIWAQDPCLNIGTCSYQVNVVDNEFPLLFCNPVTFALNADGIIVVHIDSLDNNYTDNCGLADTLIARMEDMVFGKTVQFDCSDVGQDLVILVSVTDLYGNSNTCMVSVEVQDKLGPNVVYCPPSVVLECAIDTPDLDDEPIFEDNCDPNPTVLPASSIVQGCCQTYTISRSWIATDNMGNTSICEQTIEVLDQLPPTVNCVSDITVFLDENGEGLVVVDDVFLDAQDLCCTGPLMPTFTPRVFTCSDIATTQFAVVEVTDDCNNTGSCEVLITVRDTLPPTVVDCRDFSFTASQTNVCSLEDLLELVIDELIATDNCDFEPVIYLADITTGTSTCDEPIGSFFATVVLGVRDSYGNEDNNACVLNLSYIYDINPVVATCIEEVTITLDNDGVAVLNREDVFEAVHVGPCAGIIIEYNQESVVFGCEDIGINTFTFVATQSCTSAGFSTASCQVSITVEDDIPPTIDCPEEITLSLNSNGTLDLDLDILGIVAQDNCGIDDVEIDPAILTCADIGEISVNIIVYDESGNSGECDVLVTVVVEVDPVFTGCEDVTLDLSDVGTCALIAYRDPGLYGLTASDACGNPISIDLGTASNVVNFCNPPTPGQASGTITFTVTDMFGNEGTCTINVTVINDVDPEIECTTGSPFILLLDEDGEATVDIDDLAEASFPLNCPALISSVELSAERSLTFTCDDLGTLNVLLTATLCDGRSATCSVTLEILDQIDPLIDCPADVTVECGEGPITVLGFVDDFDPSNWTESIDGDGDIIANPPSSITLLGANDGTLSAETNLCIEIPADGILRFEWSYITNDPMGPSTDPFGYLMNGLFTPLTDDAGPITQSGFVIIAVSEGDEFCFSQQSVDGLFGSATTITMQFMYSNTGLPFFVDNCSATIDFEDDFVAACGFSGTITRTWNVEDQSGNSNSCIQTITIEDTSEPVIDCPTSPIVIELNENGEATFDVPGNINASDNCGNLFYSLQEFPFTCADLGNVSFTLEVTDECDNTAVCVLNFTVQDNLAPTFPNCQSQVTFFISEHSNNCNPAYYAAPARVPTPDALDNCTTGLVVTRNPSVLEALCDGELGVAIGQIIFSAQDAAGNIGTCLTIIRVVDDVDPVPVCVPQITLELDANGIATVNTTDLVTSISDACDASPEVIEEVISYDCSNLGTNDLIVTVTDCGGNTGTCMVEVLVEDNLAPEFECVTTFTVSLDNNGQGEIANLSDLIIGNINDNCSDNFELSVDINSFDCDDLTGPVSIVLTVTDEEDNEDTCEIQIIVIDELSPEITCPFNMVISTSPGMCSGVVSFTLPLATDNCDSNPVVSSMPEIGSNIPVGLNVITLTARDESDNTSTCTFVIEVIDTEPPVALCPPNITVNNTPGQCNAVVNFVVPNPNDNCPGATSSANPPSGSMLQVGNHIILVTATDVRGNTNTCQFTVTVRDVEAPVVVCPESVTVDNDPGLCGANVSFDDPQADDNCEVFDTNISHMSGSFFPVGTTVITFTASDPSMNTATCSFSITVRDSENPVVNCPENITVDTDPGRCDAVVNYPDPTASDNCGVASIMSVPVSGSVFNRGTSIVLVQATDIYGNTATCTFTVTVRDDQEPSIDCPDDITAENDPGLCGAIVDFILPTGSDNCQVVTVTADPPPGSFFAVGTTTVTITVFDQDGLSSSCAFNIMVEDEEAPVVVCPESVTVDNDPGLCGANVSFDDPQADDNCEVFDTNISHMSGSFFPVGTTVITFTASDPSMNTATCSFSITVRDSENPVVNCPENITVDTDPGRCDAVVNYPDPTASDNCGVASIMSVPVSGSIFNRGTSIVLVQATDIYGNTATCTFTVTVRDDQEPSIDCPDDITAENDPGLCGAIVDFILPTGSDNCQVVTVTADPPPGSFFAVGTTTVTITVFDQDGLSSSCAFNIMVEDEEAPVANCRDFTLSLDQDGLGILLPSDIDDGSTDNCDIVTRIISITDFGCDDVGTPIVVILTVIDAAGNDDDCTALVTVVDEEDPIALCQDITVYLDSDGEVFIDETDIDDGSSDACGISTLELDITTVNCSDLPEIIVALTVTDVNGNQSTCTALVTILDTISPIALCQDITVYLDSNGEAFIDATDIDDGSSDACGINALVLDITMATCSDLPEVEVTLTVTDNSNNTGTCTAFVTVLDTISPVPSCPANITILNAPNLCGNNVSFTIPAASDNCTVISVIPNISSGSFFPVGATIVTVTATDQSLNTATCTFVVTVVDAQSPQVTCSPNRTITCVEDIDTEIAMFTFTATDNCEVVDTTLTISPNVNDCGVGTWTILFRAFDAAGLSAQCIRTITVLPANSASYTEDDILWPDTFRLSCGQNADPNISGLPEVPELNCASFEIDFTDGDPQSGGAGECGFFIRTWVVTDICIFDPLTGNGRYTRDQVIEIPNYEGISDMVPQNRSGIFESDPDSCGADLIIEFMLPTGFCADDITISNDYTPNGADASGFYPVGITVVTYTISNSCGVIFTDTYIIDVEDVESPTINCGLPVRMVSCEEDLEEYISDFDERGIVAEDNCVFVLSVSLEFNLSDCGVGEVIATYQATDDGDNIATCNVTYQVSSGTQNFDINDITWPAPLITSNNCAEDISPAALNSFPVSANPYYCLGFRFDFEDEELTPQGTECRRVQRTWFAISDCEDETLATFIQLIILDPNNFGPIVIDGFTRTEYGQAISHSVLEVDHQEIHGLTNDLGYYIVQELNSLVEEYVITPYNNHSSPLHGVTVADVHELNKYLHGKNRYLSPYQIIAADVDRNGVLDYKDADLIRQLILGTIVDFDASSWRFIDVMYEFKDPKNPLAEDFPEFVLIPVDGSRHYRANFVGVKMGDVNTSYTESVSFRNQVRLPWVIKDQQLKAQSWNDIPVYCSDADQLVALQATLKINLRSGESAYLIPGALGALDWNGNYADQGLFPMIWHMDGESDYLTAKDPVFTIRWFAVESRSISDQILFNADLIQPIQYHEDGLEGRPFISYEKTSLSYALYQNYPNPFVSQTWIPFELGKDAEVQLTIFDEDGKVLWKRTALEKAGRHEWLIDLSPVSAKGTLYYILETEEFKATKSMMRID